MLANDVASSVSSNDVVVVVDTPPVASQSQDNNTAAVESNITSLIRRARRHDGVKRLPSVVAATVDGLLQVADGDSIVICQYYLCRAVSASIGMDFTGFYVIGMDFTILRNRHGIY